MATEEPAGGKKSKGASPVPVRRSNSDDAFERALQSNSGSPRRRSSVNLEDLFLILQENDICENPYAVAAEFIGTFLFLFATTLGVTYSGGKMINIATGYGITLAVIIFITGPVSGGHINPAVTFALALHRAIAPKQALYYVVAQLLGAIAGVGMAYCIADELIGSIFVNERVSVTAGFFGEAVGTWLLVMTVFATAVHPSEGRQTPEKQALFSLAPMVIGWSVWAMHFALVGVTGCGINPARYIGTALVLNNWGGHEWIYIFGPMFGALIAFPTQKMIYKPDPVELEEEPVHEATRSDYPRSEVH